MVVLKEIRHEGEYAMCTYYPEDKPYPGKLKVHCPSRKIVSHEESDSDYKYGEYFIMAKKELIRLHDTDQSKKESTVMWY